MSKVAKGDVLGKDRSSTRPFPSAERRASAHKGVLSNATAMFQSFFNRDRRIHTNLCRDFMSSEHNRVSSEHRYPSSPPLSYLPLDYYVLTASPFWAITTSTHVKHQRTISRILATTPNTILGSLSFTKSASLTRENFVSYDHVKVATTQAIMFKVRADGEGVEEVPVPANVRETCIIHP